jgi:hypothetical protein
MNTYIITGVILFYSISIISGIVLPSLYSKFSFNKTAFFMLAGSAGLGISFIFSFGFVIDTLLLIFQIGSLALFFATSASQFRRKSASDSKSS